MAVCPFHDEKTPSLSLDAARGLFHCFGCGKSGDVFSWVQETHAVDFVGALELLARRAGVTLTETPGEQKRRGRREALVAAVTDARAFFLDRLRTSPDAAPARSYLRSRGYDADVVERFSIGYSPAEWDLLVRHLRDKGHSDEVVRDAGLGSRTRKGSMIDWFRGRIMFPISDLRGDPVGFGARLLDGDGPKYLNTPETPIYHKSQLLYGLDMAKSEIVRSAEAVVVEGYTDVIAFHLAGRPVAVATCGTALTDEHLGLLRRFTERVVLTFDADDAGTNAALRGFDRAVPGDLDLRVAALPDGRDPADLVGDGSFHLLVKAVESSTPLLQFRIERDLERYDLDEAESRGKAVAAVGQLIALHPDPVVRHEYSVMVSRTTGVDLQTVERSVGGSQPRGERRSPGQAERRLTGQQRAERELLRLVLANDADLRGLEFESDLVTDPVLRTGYEAVLPAVERLEPGTAPALGALLGEMDPDVAAVLSGLALEDRPLPTASDIVTKLKVGRLDEQVKALRTRLEGVDQAADPETYSDTFRELIGLETQRRELRKAGQ